MQLSNMKGYKTEDAVFVSRFLSSIYVDDVVSEATDFEDVWSFYQKCKRQEDSTFTRSSQIQSNSTVSLKEIQQLWKEV